MPCRCRRPPCRRSTSRGEARTKQRSACTHAGIDASHDQFRIGVLHDIGRGLPSRSSRAVAAAACCLVRLSPAMLTRMLWSLLTGFGTPVRIALLPAADRQHGRHSAARTAPEPADSPGVARTEPQHQSAEPRSGADHQGAGQTPFPAKGPARCPYLSLCTPPHPWPGAAPAPSGAAPDKPWRPWTMQARNKSGDNPLRPAPAKPPLSKADLFPAATRKRYEAPKNTERHSKRPVNCVELSGLEPLTSCMPCGSDKSVYVRRRRTVSLLPAPML
jgi:hypothetical protein